MLVNFGNTLLKSAWLSLRGLHLGIAITVKMYHILDNIKTFTTKFSLLNLNIFPSKILISSPFPPPPFQTFFLLPLFHLSLKSHPKFCSCTSSKLKPPNRLSTPPKSHVHRLFFIYFCTCTLTITLYFSHYLLHTLQIP